MPRTAGARNKTTIANAEAIFDLLTGSRVGFTAREIRDELDLSQQQFSTAMGYLKDVFQVGDEDGGDANPLTYDPSTYRYKFAKYQDEAEDYAKWILRRLITHANRHGHFTRAMQEKWPESRRARRIARYQANLADELEDMFAEVAATNGAPA
jgi:hypothetical protein